jgi:hypothetical protein
MKINYNGKRYDTDKCTEIAEREHYSHSNNYAGTTTLYVASDGAFILATEANGQDWHLQSGARIIDKHEAVAWLDNADPMTEEHETAAIKIGLLTPIE